MTTNYHVDDLLTHVHDVRHGEQLLLVPVSGGQHNRLVHTYNNLNNQATNASTAPFYTSITDISLIPSLSSSFSSSHPSLLMVRYTCNMLPTLNFFELAIL